jgi:hypothetical protein
VVAKIGDRRVQILHHEERDEGVESPGAQCHQEADPQDGADDAIGKGEAQPNEELVDHMTPLPCGHTACGWRRRDESDTDEGDEEGEGIDHQSPLHPEGEEQGRGQWRPDDQREGLC